MYTKIVYWIHSFKHFRFQFISKFNSTHIIDLVKLIQHSSTIPCLKDWWGCKLNWNKLKQLVILVLVYQLLYIWFDIFVLLYFVLIFAIFPSGHSMKIFKRTFFQISMTPYESSIILLRIWNRFSSHIITLVRFSSPTPKLITCLFLIKLNIEQICATVLNLFHY